MQTNAEIAAKSEIRTDYFDGKGFVNYGMHRHDTYEVLFVKRGNLKFFCDDKIYACTGSCLIFFREKKLHTTEVDSSSTYCRYNVNFKFSSLGDSLLYDDVRSVLQPDCCILDLDEKEVLEFDSLFCALYELNDKNSSVYDSMKRALLCLVLTKAAILSKNNTETSEFVMQTYITDVIEYISKNLDQKLVISDIASNFFVSRAKLISDFKAATGVTIGELIFAKRMKKAKKLLKSGVSVNAVAQECGFSSTCHFIRTFKNSTGTTPLKYSRQDLTQNL